MLSLNMYSVFILASYFGSYRLITKKSYFFLSGTRFKKTKSSFIITKVSLMNQFTTLISNSHSIFYLDNWLNKYELKKQ